MPPRAIYLAVSFALAGVLLYFSLRGLDWAGVLTTLHSAHPERIAIGFSLSISSFLLRAVRWRILLTATRPVPFATAFWATCAGYFGNAFLPARAGELVRTMAVSKKTGLSTAYVLTTALSERIVDAVTLVVISSAVLLFLPSRPGWFESATRVFVPLGLGGALAIVLIPRLEKLWRSILAKLPVPERFREKVNGILDQVMSGAQALHSPSRLISFLSITGLIWFIDGVSTAVGAWALGFSIPLPLAFLLIAGLGLGSALPSTPGFVGIYQFVAVSVLTPFGISKANAIAYILLAQGLQYVSVMFWGPLALWKLGGWRKWTGSQPESKPGIVV